MKELLFSITEKDCEFTITKGSGKGGQKRNKTSNAVYCSHEPSGAQAYSCDTRSQRTNKEIAFKRMSETRKFIVWHKKEISIQLGNEQIIKDKVEEAMKNIKIEVKENGKWVEENG